MCVRGGSRSSTKHTRGQSCTRRHRHLEALKVVLSEIATGEREGKVYSVEMPPEEPGGEHMCGFLRCSLHGTRDAAQNGEEELASTLSGLGLTREARDRACGEAASRANISWQPCAETTSQSVGNGRQWSSSSR